MAKEMSHNTQSTLKNSMLVFSFSFGKFDNLKFFFLLIIGDGFLIANEKGSLDILKAYRKKDIVLTLPGGKTLRNVKWLSVW